MSVPVHALVLDEEHLSESAAQLEGADDAVVHQETDPPVVPVVGQFDVLKLPRVKLTHYLIAKLTQYRSSR